MSKMKEPDAVIKELRQIAVSINGIADSLAEMFGEEETASEQAKPTLSLSDVRAKLAEKSRDGFTAEVKELLRSHGADKLSDVDQSEYDALLKEAEALCNG